MQFISELATVKVVIEIGLHLPKFLKKKSGTFYGSQCSQLNLMI